MCKVPLTFLLILIFSLPLFAQVDTAWVRGYNGPGNFNDAANAMVVDGYGNVYVTGYSYGSGTSYDYATVKYYPNGDTAWVRRYNGTGNADDPAQAIAIDGSGNVYVTGWSRGIGTFNDYTTIKYYPNGDTAWVRRYNGTGNADDQAQAIAIDGSGNVYVTGWSRDSGTDDDYATIKYYPNGDTAWVRRFNGTGNFYDYAHAIAVDSSGNVYVTGQSWDGETIRDYTTVKYYPNGDTAWVRKYDRSSRDDEAFAIAIDGSGNVYVTGESRSNETYDDYVTIKYYPNGDTAWVRRYNGQGNSYDRACAIAVDGCGNVYVTGYSWDIVPIGDYATIKYYPNGDTAWVRRYNGLGNNYDEANAIAVDGFGNVYVTGWSYGIGTDLDYATIKYHSSGDTAWVRRYNGPGNSSDGASAIAVDGSGNVYVTGNSYGSEAGSDYATIKYFQQPQPTEWAILVFLCADNYCEEFPIHDINEMEMVGSSTRVSIVAQIDRIPGYDSSNGDWTDTRRYYVIKDTDPDVINSFRVDSPPLGELNMGDPQTMADFVNWGIDNFPANHYAVIINGAGNGWYKKAFANDGYEYDILFKGVIWDETDGGSIGVSNGEWESAIRAIKNHLGRNIDIYVFDAPLMQMWEVMDITDEYADYMVGSEAIVYCGEWVYDQFLSALTANPTMTPVELGREIVDAAVSGGYNHQASCVALEQVASLGSAVNWFACELLKAIEDPAIDSIVDGIHSQMNSLWMFLPHYDLFDFASLIRDDIRLPNSLRDAANDVMTSVDNTITWNRVGPDCGGWCNGVAVYYPPSAYYDNNYDNLPVASNTVWDDFLTYFKRGDVNGDGVIGIGDVVYLIAYLYKGGPAPDPLAAGDTNYNEEVELGDLVCLIDYLYRGGPHVCC